MSHSVIVAGSDSKGTTRAAEKLISIIRSLERGQNSLPRINETDSNHRPFFEFSGDVSNAANIGQPMAAYFFTNDRRQGEIAKTALYKRMEDIYADCNGHDFFFRGKIMLLFWDLVEEGDVFTDDDRLAITNMLLTLTRHASQEHHGWHCHEPCEEGRLMQNHASHAAVTFFWGARYFKKYYGYTEFDELLSLATLEALGNFRRSGIVRSLLADYGGMDWTRNILWMRGRFFVIVDDFVAREDGIFEVSVYWQTLGDVTLEGNYFSVSQELDEPIPHPDDNTLNVHSVATLYIKNTGDVVSSVYPDYGYSRFASYGDQRVIILRQTKSAQLKSGECIRITNLLYATSDRDSSKNTIMEIEEKADGRVTVREGALIPGAYQPTFARVVDLGVTDALLEADGLMLDKGAFIREGTYLAVAGASRASLHGQSIIQSDGQSATEIRIDV